MHSAGCKKVQTALQLRRPGDTGDDTEYRGFPPRFCSQWVYRKGANPKCNSSLQQVRQMCTQAGNPHSANRWNRRNGIKFLNLSGKVREKKGQGRGTGGQHVGNSAGATLYRNVSGASQARCLALYSHGPAGSSHQDRGRNYYHLRFTDDETAAWRGGITCPEHTARKGQCCDLNPGLTPRYPILYVAGPILPPRPSNRTEGGVLHLPI